MGCWKGDGVRKNGNGVSRFPSPSSVLLSLFFIYLGPALVRRDREPVRVGCFVHLDVRYQGLQLLKRFQKVFNFFVISGFFFHFLRTSRKGTRNETLSHTLSISPLFLLPP